MMVSVAACQQPLHELLSESILASLKGIDFVCLPEHYPLSKEIRNLEEAAAHYLERKEYLASVSKQLQTILIGGTITEKTDRGFYNTCYIFDRGVEAGFYRKINPTPRETAAGVLRGMQFKAFDLRGTRIGILICADVLKLDSFDEMRKLDCRLVFVPTASPLRSAESIEEKQKRDRTIFVEGARHAGCPVIKTCGVGTTFGHPLQGRSLIATSEEIIAHSEPDQEDQAVLLTAQFEVTAPKG